MTRLGLVLNDSVLLSRVAADFDHTIRNPINFHNTCVFCPFFFFLRFWVCFYGSGRYRQKAVLLVRDLLLASHHLSSYGTFYYNRA